MPLHLASLSALSFPGRSQWNGIHGTLLCKPFGGYAQSYDFNYGGIL
jgi:hypothetical protein